MMGITQTAIARLAGVSTTTVSRGLTKDGIQPMNKMSKNTKYLRYSIEDARSYFNNNVFNKESVDSCKVISFYNFKGGTGKTSICFQVSSHLSMMGFNVLVIDADPQSHLSNSLGVNNTFQRPTLSDVIKGVSSLEDACQEIYPGLSCISSNLSLTRLEVILNELPKREERVNLLLSKIKKLYDFIIFDTNPTISILNRNILVASDLVSIVCETQPYSLNGLKMLMEDMSEFYDNMQLKHPNIFVIPNKYEDRATSSAEAMAVLKQYYEEYMCPDFAIRRSEDINTSAKLAQPLAFFARTNSIAFEDIVDLIHILLNRINPNIKLQKPTS